jgi:hypothetical protein
MKAKEENKNGQIVPSQPLTDLPVADAQADDTKCGKDSTHKGTIEISSWSWRASDPSTQSDLLPFQLTPLNWMP